MTLKKHKQIVEMFYKEWDLGKRASKVQGKICAWIYWYDILSQSEKIIIEKDQNRVIGVCGYTKWKSKKHSFRKNWYRLLKHLLMLNPSIKNKKALKEYYKNYDYLPKELSGCFDGEVSILIVDKEYRGKQIGTKLLNQIFQLAKEDKVKKLQILTDDSCNYKFYENLGCKKMYETIVQNGGIEHTESAYIFEKELIY